jgi:UDP:flavonoid glycosyltransferase YjiC (YdhE family)
VAHGDAVLVVGPPALEVMGVGAGMPFVPGGEPSEAEIAPIRERLPVVPPEEAVVLGNRDLFGRMAATAMLPAMENVCMSWAPDLVLREPCEYSSAVVASRLGLPVAQVAISLAEGEEASITAASPALEEHRPGLTEEVRRAPYLTRFPASLDPSPFASTVRYREPSLVSDEGLPHWWDGSQAPLVYLTFGTVLGHMSIAADVYDAALRAVDGLPVRVLLTVGRRFDPSALGSVPANVHVESWVDQDDVLPHADLVVSHGGSGTSYGALAAGVPLVLVPVFADQFENARRIADRGAGLTVDAIEDTPGLVGAIEQVLATPGYREEARKIATEMATGPTVQQVLVELLR